MASVFGAAMKEWRRSYEALGDVGPGGQNRIDRVMNTAIATELSRLERYMNFLATVGSVAPFVGLFGTVWGIMNSFQSIAISRDTNLAGGSAWDCGGFVCHRIRLARSDPRGDGL